MLPFEGVLICREIYFTDGLYNDLYVYTHMLLSHNQFEYHGEQGRIWTKSVKWTLEKSCVYPYYVLIVYWNWFINHFASFPGLLSVLWMPVYHWYVTIWLILECLPHASLLLAFCYRGASPPKPLLSPPPIIVAQKIKNNRNNGILYCFKNNGLLSFAPPPPRKIFSEESQSDVNSLRIRMTSYEGNIHEPIYHTFLSFKCSTIQHTQNQWRSKMLTLQPEL